MTEPIYEYIKGKGWVVQTVETYTTSYQGRTVTLYKRPPEPHERGWYAYDTFSFSLETVFQNMTCYRDSILNLGWPGEYHHDKDNIERNNPRIVYVVTVEVT